MNTHNKILSELGQLKALGQTMIDKATHLEKLLVGGEGKKSLASTRKGEIHKIAAQVLANRNKTISNGKSL